MVRGIRGATTVQANTVADITKETYVLVNEMIAKNKLKPEMVAHVLFTVTADLNEAFPAKVLRELNGWEYVPVVCAQEIPVPESLPLCVRVLMTVNTDQSQSDIDHIYLNDAVKLRPDLSLTNK
ncbi:chorismate mutase [Halalkalibacter hemicellulosilyticus]|uniref:chorismate mutase n=1 Tax=Halalkalibacter hemicellulosilyticusJCM 9152 TaxID=1236971 RepID=W4QCD0_9BACI|nr:chorismate mutase [Halalkalibacter hemicellulosilyticus]GAE29019.1 chorismate mutase II [Halalkalibacter hemicellulosilyticusJCM 9152]